MKPCADQKHGVDYYARPFLVASPTTKDARDRNYDCDDCKKWAENMADSKDPLREPVYFPLKET